MFTKPPLPPTEYELRNITLKQLTNPEFTPDQIRITLPTIGKYCYPIFKEEIDPTKLKIEKVPDQILGRWADVARAEWVDPPGKNAFYLHDFLKKYSVKVVDELDPRYQHKPSIFPRSFKYEIDCIEEKRLEKLYAKMAKEESEKMKKDRLCEEKKIAEKKPSIEVLPCKLKPPFWWSFDGVHEERGNFDQMESRNCNVKRQFEGSKKFVDGKKLEIEKPKKIAKSMFDSEVYLRWQEKPKLWSTLQDPCDKRKDMLLVGQPFYNEACNWYYINYPPPNIPFRPKKFT